MSIGTAIPWKYNEIMKRHMLRRTIEMKYFLWAFFYFHLALFITSNVLLIVSNMIISPGHLWFVIPLASWGVWVFAHFFITFFIVSDSARDWRSAQLEKAISEEKNAGIAVQEAQRRASTRFFFWMLFYFHLAVFIGGNTVLVLINLLVHSSTLWCLIPLSGWGLWLLFHFFLTFLMLGDQVRPWREKTIELLTFRDLVRENEQKACRDASLRFFFWVLLALHVGLYVFCNMMMFVINKLNDPAHSWFIWPLIAWGLFLLAHAGLTYVTSSSVMVRWREEQLRRLSDEDI